MILFPSYVTWSHGFMSHSVIYTFMRRKMSALTSFVFGRLTNNSNKINMVPEKDHEIVQ